MTWADIKRTPRSELQGLILALSNYNLIHAYDGYNDKDIGEMAKSKPEVRGQYAKALEMKRIYSERAGLADKARPKNFSELLNG